MQPPAEDLEDRALIWNSMQEFWMDTDPVVSFPGIVHICAESKYTLEELEAIFWNEIRPAVAFNLLMLPAPEWAGFEIEWLKKQVLLKSRFGKTLPYKWLRPVSAYWWRKLRAGIVQHRRSNM